MFDDSFKGGFEIDLSSFLAFKVDREPAIEAFTMIVQLPNLKLWLTNKFTFCYVFLHDVDDDIIIKCV